MQDRYLFKAKRKDNCEWVFGGLSYCDKTGAYFITNMGKDHISYIGFHQEVDPDTICQCTGIPDKNSRVAYEHDIIKTPVGNAKIIWNCSPSPTDNHINVGFEVVFTDATVNDNYRHDLGYWIGKSEVICSEIENPELLEGSHDGE